MQASFFIKGLFYYALNSLSQTPVDVLFNRMQTTTTATSLECSLHFALFAVFCSSGRARNQDITIPTVIQ